jgi:protein Mpv17
VLLRRPKLTPTHFAGVFGPLATQWFKFLQHKIRLPNKNAEILTRVAVDQLCFAPAHLVVFLSTMATLEGSDPKEKLEKTYTTALTKNWIVWPWVQLVNFKFVPLEHRVMLVNVVSIGEFSRIANCSCWYTLLRRTGWNCYLSYLNSQQ